MINLYLMETDGDQSAAAKTLLLKVLERDYNIQSPVIHHTEKGKPFLENGPCFSISHSRGYVGLAVGDSALGLDLELVRSFHEKLPKRIFSPGELEWFVSRRETKADFFTLWTLKESYYKYLGTGLTGFPNGTEFYKDKSWHLRDSQCIFSVIEEKNLLIAVCSDKQMMINLLWE